MYVIASRISFHFDTFVVVFELDPLQSQLEDLYFVEFLALLAQVLVHFLLNPLSI